jgi:hypothetical protein
VRGGLLLVLWAGVSPALFFSPDTGGYRECRAGCREATPAGRSVVVGARLSEYIPGMGQASEDKQVSDRRLGDEWADWDGRSRESTESNYRLFLGMVVLAALVLVVSGGLFLWLIYPRLMSLGNMVAQAASLTFIAAGVLLLIWTILFIWAAVTRHSLTRRIASPRLINRLLSLISSIGHALGISIDRLTNSFLKINNAMIGTQPDRVAPEELLVLTPRCLTRENSRTLRSMRDRLNFQMATVGGGSEARKKIRQIRPRLVVAIACERDLLSGFKEVNPYVPVVGFPNQRPEGPCKNTCVDIAAVERMILRCLASSGT